MSNAHITHGEIVAALSKKTGLSEPQTKAFLQAQAELAYEHAANGYPIAGIGTFTLGERPERTLVMQFGPKKGQSVHVPSARKLLLRPSKAAMNVVLRGKAILADVMMEEVYFPEGEPQQED